MTTTTETLARVTELEVQLETAQAESTRAQALAIALPGRLAAGDQSVTTADLIHAGPVVAVAKAKVTALANQLAVAQAEHEGASTAELVAQLRAGKPFISPDQVEKELARIAAILTKELAKFGKRIDAHNEAFFGVMEGLRLGDRRTFDTGADDASLTIERTYSGPTIELDGQEWFELRADGWAKDVADIVVMAELVAQETQRNPYFSSADDSGVSPEVMAELVAGANPM